MEVFFFGIAVGAVVTFILIAIFLLLSRPDEEESITD